MKKIVFILFSMSICYHAFAQIENRTTYPYGGICDSSRYTYWMKDYIPLNFILDVDFGFAIFNSAADFRFAIFVGDAHFTKALFNSTAYFAEARFYSAAEFRFLEFHSTLDFAGAIFNSEAHFSRAKFDSTADFRFAKFENEVDFNWAIFNSEAHFRFTKFDSVADFGFARFYSKVYFNSAIFNSMVYCNWALFNSTADFSKTKFDSTADFSKAKFDSAVNFEGAIFDGKADFNQVKFNSKAGFRFSEFHSTADFAGAQFKNKISFYKANFCRSIDLSNVRIASKEIIDFSSSILRDTVIVGDTIYFATPVYDFGRTKMLKSGKIIFSTDTLDTGKITKPSKIIKYPGAKILIYSPVVLKIQLEKFEFLEILNTLDYYSKKDIITALKDSSFSETKYAKERFELDYIFEKSTMYQKENTYYELYSFFNPITWWNTIYYLTMGLGYRPFRLIYWAIGIILLFSLYYYIRMGKQINYYISKLEKDQTSQPKKKFEIDFFSQYLNCIYFSAMLFFTFRLKGDLLTSFNSKDKRIIVTEWFIGFLVYIAFLTLSQTGSILYTLKSLFIG